MAKAKTKNEIVIDLLSSYKQVAPETINAAIGGKYATKYISLLRKDGYEIKSVKEGRTVVGYLLVASTMPTAADETVEDEAEEEVNETFVSAASEDDEDVVPLAASSDDDEDEVAVSDDWDDFDGDVRTLVS